MARRRASMREGPLAELFRATEAAQRQAEQQEKESAPAPPAEEPEERTVEHVPTWEEAARTEPPAPPPPRPVPPPTPPPPPPEPRSIEPMPEAPVKGQSILAYDPTGDAAFMYRQLAKEVLDGASAREHA